MRLSASLLSFILFVGIFANRTQAMWLFSTKKYNTEVKDQTDHFNNMHKECLDVAKNHLIDEHFGTRKVKQDKVAITISVGPLYSDQVFTIEELKTVLDQASKLNSTSLSLSGLGIDDDKAQLIANMLSTNKNLEFLNLFANHIKDQGIKAIAQALKENKSLRSLNIGFNKFGDEGIEEIADMLQNNQTLQELGLNLSNLGDSSLKIIAGALKKNAALTHISLNRLLGSNSLDAINELASAIGEHKSLISVNLAGYYVFSGQIDFAKMLASKTLIELDLSFGTAASNQLSLLVGALKENTTLKTIKIYNNYYDNKAASQLKTLLENNKSLVSINLANNELQDAGVKILADGLSKNSTVQYLTMVNNAVSRAGREPLNNLKNPNLFIYWLYSYDLYK